MTRACDSKPGRGVPAGPIRERITMLLDAGASYLSIARAAGVHERTVRHLHSGKRPSVYRGTAECIMAVNDLALSPDRVVDAGPTRERIAKLLANDWRLVDIADHAGLSPTTLLASNLEHGVSLRTEQRVEHVWRSFMGVKGNKARPYPHLTAGVATFTRREIAAGADISYSTVDRLRAGHPINRDTAERVTDWLAQQRRGPQRAPQIVPVHYGQAA